MKRQPRLAAGRARALGLPTRGTTNPNRLRRMDNWIAITQASLIRSADSPLIIDLGFGASPITAVELLQRLRPVRADVHVLGLEIDAERVAAAQPAAGPGLSFAHGGFELAGRRPLLVRAANVLRQYPEAEVQPAWQAMQRQLAPGGVIVDGTCDELGRRGSWTLVSAAGPVSLTLFSKPDAIQRPSDIADRLVKALIHRNVPGEAVHELLRAMDRAWDLHAPLAAFGNRQRWAAMCETLAEQWPLLSTPARHRSGELTVSWHAVAPSG
ncbi:MAG TPA: class I SAM-dependent methyltransferase [Jatrophihabitans sp.]|nr:class I SAM-dependent methyltransferase [Jatrophihabitans sp.]